MPRIWERDVSRTINIDEWEPRTRIGKKVLEGEIESIDQLLFNGVKIKEPEIVVKLVPNLKYATLKLRRVIRMSGTGRKPSFGALVVVGNEDGYVGVGYAKSAEDRLKAIEKALNKALLNVSKVIRGCGSWECRCGTPHSIPVKTIGKRGSVRVVLKPAPKGSGRVIGDYGKVVIKYAGIRDVWCNTFGQTKTTINFIFAIKDALDNIYKYYRDELPDNLKI